MFIIINITAGRESTLSLTKSIGTNSGYYPPTLKLFSKMGIMLSAYNFINCFLREIRNYDFDLQIPPIIAIIMFIINIITCYI